MLPAPRGLLRASGRSCSSACGPGRARGSPVTPWGAACPAAAGWTQAGSRCPLENGLRQGQSQEAASDGATAEIPGSLLGPCVLSLFAKFWEDTRQAFPSRNPTDSVSLPSTCLWGAELKVGSGPGLASITHEVGGRDSLGSFYVFFLQRELAFTSCHVFIAYVTHQLLKLQGEQMMEEAMGEKSLPQTQRCEAPVLRRRHFCTSRFPWTYGAAGRTPLPAEQINFRGPRRVEVKPQCTVLTKLTFHRGTCQRTVPRPKA